MIPKKSNHAQLLSNWRKQADGVGELRLLAFSGDSSIPVGTYIGFEDIMPLSSADRDYNDHQFVFTNVKTNSHGIPDSASTLALVGLATAGMVALRRRVMA